MIGTTVGSYRILQLLGEGGMGAVYLAEHSLLGRRAAIKVLLPMLSSRQEIVTRFFNEARAATAIADPGIVQIFDFGYHEGVAFIVMELLLGEALDKRLERVGAMLPVDALRVTRQIAATLGSAHARGIVHRDLKPENVFLVKDPEVAGGERVKILDFGIAKLAGSVDPGQVKTQLGAVMGTPLYMSPEQCRGSGELDHRSDVYALGCVLYHMLMGRPPFVAEGMGEILAMQMFEAAIPPSVARPALGEGLDPLVMRCLAKQPGDRFANMAEVAAEAERLLLSIGGSGVGWAAGDGAGGSIDWRAPSLVRTPTPTTLGGAAGARETAAAAPGGAGRRRGGLVIAAAVVMVGAAVAGVLALGGGGGGGGGEPAGTPPGEPAIVPGLAIDAGVGEMIAIDAPEAPPIDAAPVPVDAAEPPIDAQKKKHGGGKKPETTVKPPVVKPETAPPACPTDEFGVPTQRC